ncbi:MAG: threonine--tRNA ligase [Candidatus Brockarchaeota archaeon]|nr:threonine--tRNA ligase [Candidatus Brockarchaeota archaeon]MBO3767779.1 threonine--tRNA ligase [Candidatus Brockarchaeota archaeon]MBO3801097.1 threonine--tRNA ligase [Candidatus Brockarchaeota archaeon]
MRLLQLHADSFEYEPIKKETENAEELVDKSPKSFKDIVVLLVSVEKDDSQSSIRSVVESIKKSLDDLKVSRVLIYPYSHLSNELASPSQAKIILETLSEELKNSGVDVTLAPFGWTKKFTIAIKGHPLAEQFKTIKGMYDEEGPVTTAVVAERKLKSYWYIMDENGALIPIEQFNFSSHDNLKKFMQYEVSKSRVVTQIPPHVQLMQRHSIASYEEASDAGNMRWYPKGKLIKSLIEEYVSLKVSEYGALEVETPIMYNINHPALESYLSRFPARQYIVKSGDKEFFLRFAACFGQFLMASQATISYRNLPLKLYELTKYSFRREKSGEVVGLRRLRAFTMPDCHAFVKDMNQAKEEMKARFRIILNVIEELGVGKENVEMAIRFTKDFFENNKEFIVSLVREFGKPVLVEMWEERFFYFVLKYELNFIDNLGKASALSTDQIDVENGVRFGITFVDEDGTKKNPIILHMSPSGAIERVIYALLEKAYADQDKGKVPELPLWLSPTQVRFIPISKEFIDTTLKFAETLSEKRIRADVDDRDETVQKKIREAEREWIRYIVVVGERELKSGKLSVRNRLTGKIAELSIEELASDILEETKDKPYKPLPLPVLLSKRPIF